MDGVGDEDGGARGFTVEDAVGAGVLGATGFEAGRVNASGQEFCEGYGRP